MACLFAFTLYYLHRVFDFQLIVHTLKHVVLYHLENNEELYFIKIKHRHRSETLWSLNNQTIFAMSLAIMAIILLAKRLLKSDLSEDDEGEDSNLLRRNENNFCEKIS